MSAPELPNFSNGLEFEAVLHDLIRLADRRELSDAELLLRVTHARTQYRNNEPQHAQGGN